VRVDTEYSFDTDEGTKTLLELFDGRSQLLVFHFMFGPEDTEGCPGCSFVADHVDGAVAHLEHHDVSFLAAARSRGSTRTSAGWAGASLGVVNVRRDEPHGLSAFALEGEVVYHTYSCYDRGTDVLHGTRQLLDRAPKGPGEKSAGSPGVEFQVPGLARPGATTPIPGPPSHSTAEQSDSKPPRRIGADDDRQRECAGIREPPPPADPGRAQGEALLVHLGKSRFDREASRSSPSPAAARGWVYSRALADV
jgi:hypothetical protein